MERVCVYINAHLNANSKIYVWRCNLNWNLFSSFPPLLFALIFYIHLRWTMDIEISHSVCVCVLMPTCTCTVHVILSLLIVLIMGNSWNGGFFHTNEKLHAFFLAFPFIQATDNGRAEITFGWVWSCIVLVGPNDINMLAISYTMYVYGPHQFCHGIIIIHDYTTILRSLPRIR